MSRSLFEGGAFGASDVGVCFGIAALLAYLVIALAPQATRATMIRPLLGLVASTGLVTLSIVQGLKWAVGRVRPYLVGSPPAHLPFTAWFHFGAQDLAHGRFNGSFPSGHTATVCIFLALAYALFATPRLTPRLRRRLGLAVGLLVVCGAVAMGVARSMDRMHWVTDWLGAIVLSWLAVHWLYFRALCVPDQYALLARRGYLPNAGRAWEVSLACCCVGLIAGVAAAVLATRSAWTAGLSPRFALLLLFGCFLAWISARGLRVLRRRLVVAFEEA